MNGLAPFIAGGVAAVLCVEYLSTVPAAPATADSASVPTMLVDRSHKGDRLAARSDREKAWIAVVEVVGLRNTAIVYRDRDGNELFRTDPLTNTTVVTRDVLLPEVTIRESGRASVSPVPVELRGSPAEPVTPARLPAGCEPAFSPLTAPALSRGASRCYAASDRISHVAALSH